MTCVVPDKMAPQASECATFLHFGALSAEFPRWLCPVFAAYLRYATEPTRLVLAADRLSRKAARALHAAAAQYGISPFLEIIRITDAEQHRALCRMAHVALCARNSRKRDIIEAARQGLPLLHVHTEIGASAPTLPGLHLVPDSPEELAALLRALFREPGLRRALRRDQQAALTNRSLFRKALRKLARPFGFARQPGAAWKLEGPFDSSYSLALVNRSLACALQSRGIDIGLDITPESAESPPDARFLAEHPDIQRLHQRGQAGDGWNDVVLRNTYPPTTLVMQGNTRVMQSYAWEETAFPERFASGFNHRLDLITVLSRQSEKILRDSGVSLPITVVGCGGDHIDMPAAPSLPGDFGKEYRFLHISSAFPRKGVDALLAAWGKAFRATDPVSLILKTVPNPHNDVQEQLAAWRERDPGYPDVILINEDWPPKRIHALYRHCHALVAPSRGEGFGLPCLEAMRLGLPLIVTGWGGQMDFVNADNAWLIDHSFAPARSHLETGHSAWAEPDVDHLAQCLREVHAAPSEILEAKTRKARQVAQAHTWARVAQRTEESLAQLEARPQISHEPHIVCVSSWNDRCGIATYAGFLLAACPPGRLRVFACHTDEPSAADAPNVFRCWRKHATEPLRAILNAVTADAIVIQQHPDFIRPQQLAALLADAQARGQQTHLFLHKSHEFSQVKTSPFAPCRAILAQTTRIYVHGIQDLNNLKSFGLEENVTLFPHGIPVFPRADREELRKKHGLAQKRVIAAYGFLMPHKGCQPLLRAVHRLLPEAPDLHLILCCALYPNHASHEEHRQLEALIRELKMEARVTRIHAFLPEAESLQWLCMADLQVFPYQHSEESASGAVRMGFTSGQPVAVTPLAIFDDLGDAVWRLPGTDVDSIASGLRAWLAQPGLLQPIQENARRFLAARAWPTVSRRFLNLLHGLANPL
ncbi:MAG: glycosyltransferase [Zoogloeaceae bacterium]|jgi:glycosyltransferase involved in cell wall biosynthesis|nr:glycosyltransferase [Zoogloeaceae bacterium]